MRPFFEKKEHLQPWYDQWLEKYADTDLIYARVGGRVMSPQVHFVRDVLSQVVLQGIPYADRPVATPRDDCRLSAHVIGTHRSKSVVLPVFLLEREDLGVSFIARNNFYDWNLTVLSDREIPADVLRNAAALDFSDADKRARWSPGSYWGYCFFQGFPSFACLGPHSIDPRAFSTWMENDYEIYTFVWLVMRFLREGR